MTDTATKKSLLIFESRTEGHHLHWLRLFSDAFLSAGFHVTLAVDNRPEAADKVARALEEIGGSSKMLPVFDESGRPRGGGKIDAVAACLRESGAGEVLMPNLDDIASSCFRKAAFGFFPPAVLKGRLSGVYIRPRPLERPSRPLQNAWKRIGLRRMWKSGWFGRIWILDEYLQEEIRERRPEMRCHFLPDPGFGDFSLSPAEARRKLGIEREKFVFLCYGIPSRRKGLHIAADAMMKESAHSDLFLLSAGGVPEVAGVRSKLDRLADGGRALVLDRYVTEEEERLCFCASDVVLAPYLNHYGSSGILSKAAAAGKPTVASDEGLVAKRVVRGKLGWTFPSGDSDALLAVMRQAAGLGKAEMEAFRESARAYARTCSREAFRRALLDPYHQ